ncbi:MAG: dihydropteroate synthase [Bacteroidales bacterium]|nr:dihydropteroate synthase [Bacteroidales bacterium]
MSKGTFFSSFTLHCGKNIVSFEHPCILGILNVTPDSFYDGGRHVTPEQIVTHGRQLLADGADIIDVGVVSSRPGAVLLDPAEEARRLSEVVRLLRAELPEDTIISVDTCYSLPAEAAVRAGAAIINDISGGQFDPRMFDAVADLHVPYVLSHTRGLPSEMMQYAHYEDILLELQHYFSELLDKVYRLGMTDVILDPGFGFAKTAEQNFDLLSRLEGLTEVFREPILVGVSRKRMIYETLKSSPQESLNGTTVINTIALEKGVQMLRVHDPREAREAAVICERMHECTKKRD